MINSILGKKVEMSQVFDEQGNMIPVTVIEAGPCVVTQVKTKDHDGYNAIQIGFAEKKIKNTSAPLKGHFSKAGTTPKRKVQEVKIEKTDDFKLGDKITCDIFKPGDMVDVVGTSKGKGFQGTIKSHHFSRGPESHGSMNVRAPGSIGSNTFPGRVLKGKLMATHLGNKRSTVRNLVVVKVDTNRNVLLVKGAVPGNSGSFVTVRRAKYQR